MFSTILSSRHFNHHNKWWFKLYNIIIYLLMIISRISLGELFSKAARKVFSPSVSIFSWTTLKCSVHVDNYISHSKPAIISVYYYHFRLSFLVLSAFLLDEKAFSSEPDVEGQFLAQTNWKYWNDLWTDKPIWR